MRVQQARTMTAHAHTKRTRCSDGNTGVDPRSNMAATWGKGTVLCALCRELAGEGAQKEDALLRAVNTFGAILAKVAGLERLDLLPDNPWIFEQVQI